MSHKWSGVLAMLIVASCSAQTSGTDQHANQLIEHWRWKQYWEGTTELGAMYSPGRQFQALLFWRTDEMPPSVGFCSSDLGVCQFYPNAPGTENSFETKIRPGEDARSAYQRFLADSFEEKSLSGRLPGIGRPPEIGRSAGPNAADYTIDMVKITLPALDPPEAIRNRKPQPRAEVDALVASLSCLSDQPGCKVHLMIPFYSHNDPNVPVFRQCSGCPNPKPMIIFMKLIEGNWWHGAIDFNASPDVVDRTRKQIEKALMLVKSLGATAPKRSHLAGVRAESSVATASAFEEPATAVRCGAAGATDLPC